MPARFLLSTTMQKQSFSMFTIAPARSTIFRTGVHLLPMIIGLVTTAPSQWKKFRISGPATPGKRYLFPPEKPTTSCGNTGPMMMDLLVIEEHSIDLHRHIHGEESVRKAADLI